MAGQATLNDDPRTGNHTFMGRVAGVGHDVLAIVELQTRLFVLDIRALGTTALVATALGAVAAVLLLAALPVLLFAFGYWIAEATGWSLPLSLFVVAVVAVVASSAIGAVAWFKVAKQVHVLRRSAEELQANLAALKNVLSDYSRPNDD